MSLALGFGITGVSRVWSAEEASSEHRPVKSVAIFQVHTTQRLVSLTFDDGPDPRWTPQVLDVLHQHGAQATFFDTGINALAHPDLIAAEIAGGHEIGDHTWSHPDLRLLSPSAMKSELVKGAEAIHAAGAPVPLLFRPPYGSTDDAVAVAAATGGYRTVRWNLCLERYVNHGLGVVEGVEAVLGQVRPGSIILAHDGGIPDRTRTMQALSMLLTGLQARGYRVVDASTLLASAQRPRPTSVSPAAA